MSDFKDSLKVDTNREQIIREEIIEILSGNKTIKEICKSNKESNTGLPINPKTIKGLIEKYAGQDDEIYNLFIEYQEKKTNRDRGYDYAAEIIYMIEKDLSQRQVAYIYGISRNTLKSAITKMREDNEFKTLIDDHTNRHAIGRNFEKISEQARKKQESIIKNLKKKYSIKEEKETGMEIEIPKDYSKNNEQTKNPATLRRYKATRDRLLKIAEKAREQENNKQDSETEYSI